MAATRDFGGVAAILFCLGISGLLAAEPQNLVFNGDLEATSADSPPPGWVMWGANQYKTAANFTRHADQPHAGAACLRIHHPANTAGYLVSDPAHAITTHKGMRYVVSFWARAAKPGSAVFGLEAYQDLKTFTDAPGPGFFAVNVSTEWKPFTFEVHEGWDFFASKARFLIVVLKATPDQKEEQTLLVDDVVAQEWPASREGRMLEDGELTIAPLEHRLTRGEQLRFSVDAGKKWRRAVREAGGISFHRVAGWAGVPYDKQGNYVLQPELEAAVRDLRLPMTRFYAVGAEAFPLEASIDKAAELCQRVKVPAEKVVLEFETQGATSTLPPDVWARGVKHAQDRGYGFHRWEITNEPYVGSAKVMFPTSEVYAKHFLEVSPAVHAAQPESQIGLSIHGRSTTWGDYLLKRCAGQYDFVVAHWYCFMNVHKNSFEDVVLRGNAETLEELLRINALMKAYNPGRDVYQYDTEWGMHSSGPNGEGAGQVARNSNIVGTLHRAVRLIYYTREELLRGASSWEMFVRAKSSGFGVLAPDAAEKRFLIYWLYYHFNRHVGEWALEPQGAAPFHEWKSGEKTGAMPLTPVLATLSADGKELYLVIVNGSWNKAVPCAATLQHFAAVKAKALVLTQESMDADPLIAREADVVSELPVKIEDGTLRCTVPPHAAVFITVSAK
jgi:hypothetical protein